MHLSLCNNYIIKTKSNEVKAACQFVQHVLVFLYIFSPHIISFSHLLSTIKKYASKNSQLDVVSEILLFL